MGFLSICVPHELVDTHVEAPSPFDFGGLAVPAWLPFEFLDEFLGDYQGPNFVSLLHRLLFRNPDFGAFRARGPTGIRQTLDRLNEFHLSCSFCGKGRSLRRIVQCNLQERRTDVGSPAFLDDPRQARRGKHFLSLFLCLALPSIFPTSASALLGDRELAGERSPSPRRGGVGDLPGLQFPLSSWRLWP